MGNTLTTSSSFFHLLSLPHREESYLYYVLEGKSVVFAKSSIETPPSNRDVVMVEYNSMEEIAQYLVENHPKDHVSLCEVEIPVKLFNLLKESSLSIDLVEGHSFRVDDYFKLWEECVNCSESVFLYFLSSLYGMSYQEHFVLKNIDKNERQKPLHLYDELIRELTHRLVSYLVLRGSMEKHVQLSLFSLEEQKFISLEYCYAKAGVRTPLALTLALNDEAGGGKNTNDFKNRYDELSSSMNGLEFNDVNEWKKTLMTELEKRDFCRDKIKIDSLSTLYDEREELKQSGKLCQGGRYFVKVQLHHEEPLFWSNIYQYEGRCFQPVYRTNELMLEVDL